MAPIIPIGSCANPGDVLAGWEAQLVTEQAPFFPDVVIYTR
jgi:hypothetical protein